MVVGGRVEEVEKLEGRGEAVAILDAVRCNVFREARLFESPKDNGGGGLLTWS